MEARKQLSFDLDTNILKEMFGEDKYTKAYSDIKSFMKKNGCEHIEGSVYMSKQSMSNLEVLNLLADLKEQFPYITKCVREMHQANISNIHSLSAEFEYDGTAGKFAQKEDVKQENRDKAVSRNTSKSEKQPSKSIKEPTSIADRIAQKKVLLSHRESKQKSQERHKSSEHNL